VRALRKFSVRKAPIVLGVVVGSLGLILLLTAGLPAWRRAGDTPVAATARAAVQAALRTSPKSESTEVARASDVNDWVVLFTELYKGGSSRGLVFSDKLVALNGKRVVMTGFMAPPLKPALDFFVLTRVPLSLCPFCASDAEWPEDIVFVRMPLGKTIQPTSATVRVTGQLDIGTKTDEATGFVSLVRIAADGVQVLR
jgi:hypothetical protein